MVNKSLISNLNLSSQWKIINIKLQGRYIIYPPSIHNSIYFGDPFAGLYMCGSFSPGESFRSRQLQSRLRNLLFNFPLLQPAPPSLPPSVRAKRSPRYPQLSHVSLCLPLSFRARKFQIFPQGRHHFTVLPICI